MEEPIFLNIVYIICVCCMIIYFNPMIFHLHYNSLCTQIKVSICSNIEKLNYTIFTIVPIGVLKKTSIGN